MTYEGLLKSEPYSLSQVEKTKHLTELLLQLTKLHQERCTSYRNILSVLGVDTDAICDLKDIPFLPVRIFKELALMSTPREEIFKIVTSSGTNGQKVSKIFLDRETANRQQKTLSRIVSSFIGSSRMPMIIIDCPSVVKNREMFSARGAGINGFSIFGRDKIYALDDDMNLQREAVENFLQKNSNQPIFLFGFTFMIWKYFYQSLKKENQRLNLKNGILIHGGGWKKLAEEAVSSQQFKTALHDVCGIEKVYDYYGMAEQTGCIAMECEAGNLHTSIFSEVIVRRGFDFSVCEIGERGILQVLSSLPLSYPGHSLLTEDEGAILGVDDCPCGRRGKYFKVFGRLQNAEIRGCSDTYAAKVR